MDADDYNQESDDQGSMQGENGLEFVEEANEGVPVMDGRYL